MKNSRGVNRKRLIPLAAAVIAMAMFAFIRGGLGFKTAYVIKTDSDTEMVLMDNSPVVVKDETPRKNAFKNCSTGDRVLVVASAVAESWPGRTSVHWCVKIDGGDYTNIPEDVLAHLSELGYTVVGEILLDSEKAAPVLAEYVAEISFIEDAADMEIKIIDDITMDIIKHHAALQNDNKDYRFGEMMADFAMAISGGEAVQ